jgi:DNA-binding NarL/FixJ family response regulator
MRRVQQQRQALASLAPRPAAAHRRAPDDSRVLSLREREVALLVARGDTNRQIGEAWWSPKARRHCTSNMP